MLSGYDVVACNRCGFCYADKIPGQNAFDQYYRTMSKYELPAQPNERDKTRFEELAGILSGCIPSKQSRILEIGCANGHLLYLLKQRGYSKLTGLDPSRYCCQYARKKHGVKCKHGTIFDFRPRQESFDVIILSGVLEHVRDLHPALCLFNKWLSPEGRLFIVVPAADRYTECENAPFQELSAEHINFFGKRSLQNLMSNAGFGMLSYDPGLNRPNDCTVIPVINACFEKSTEQPPIHNDTFTGKVLEEYISRSRAGHLEVQRKLEQIAKESAYLMVWGCGTHTLRLLADSALSWANISAIVDSNPIYQGKCVGGIPVVSPESVRDFPGSILASSWSAQEDILKQIKALNPAAKTITLY